MDLYMKQRMFSWNDRFYIYDISGKEVFYVEGEIFSWGKKLHLYDMNGYELAFIQQKLFSFHPRYYIYRTGIQAAEVVKQFTFFRDEYIVNGLGWRVRGDFWDHNYEISDGYRTMASVCKEWFSFGDAYRIWLDGASDVVAVLSVILVIDACIEAEQRN